ncbi:MAG: cation-efflux pump [Candidatus Acidiferrales bacterium]
MTAADVIREKKRAALESVGSSLLLVFMKVALAVTTGSLGILSEALHSSLDLISTVITYLSVRVSDKPADAEHQFGHAKVENFSSFVVTGLLLVAALYIVWEAFQRMLFRDVHIEPSVVALVILALTIVVDAVRARALRRVARKYGSEALEADALHFSTDIWSTVVVMLGIAVVWAGESFDLPWLRFADPVAALIVSGVIIWVGGQLGRRSLDALLDAAPTGLQQRIAAAVNHLEGVLATERLRVRRAGNHHFVDITISVPRTRTFEQVHAVSDAVEKRVQEIIPADVMVHMEPRAHPGEHVFDVVRAIALRNGLAIHELSAHHMDGRLFLDLHLEVDEALSLREAHRHATVLEQEVLREAGVGGVNIHIEPLGAHIASADKMTELSRAVQQFINGLGAEYHELVNCHEVQVRRAENKILVSCHCAMHGELPITQIHDVTAALEDRVKERFAQIARVTIHPEPPEES